MFRGYRGIFIATGLAALLIAFGLGAYTVNLNQPEQQRYQEYETSNDDERGSPLSVARDLPRAKVQRTPCDNPNSESESDLCAQWKAANAAEDSAFWTKWGFWVAIIGSSFLLWQIILTREAVKDTGDATKAMQDANEIADLNAKRQLRAYVYTDIGTFDIDESDRVLISLQIKNFGQTPAPIQLANATLGLADVIEGLKIKTETNIDLVKNVIYGGHYWALGWEMPHLFHNHIDKRSRVRFVVDVLDMWSFLEEAFEELDDGDKVRLAELADPFGTQVRFPGFDGNNETEYMSIARFMITDLRRFRRFQDRKHDLNSHCPKLETYGAMYRAFEPIRKTLVSGKAMSVEQLAEVLNARRNFHG